MKLIPDSKEIWFWKNKIPDSELGFEMPRMTPEVIRELLNWWPARPILQWLDPRYTPKQ